MAIHLLISSSASDCVFSHKIRRRHKRERTVDTGSGVRRGFATTANQSTNYMSILYVSLNSHQRAPPANSPIKMDRAAFTATCADISVVVPILRLKLMQITGCPVPEFFEFYALWDSDTIHILAFARQKAAQYQEVLQSDLS